MLPTRISSRLAVATRYDRTCSEVLDWHEHHNLSFCFVMKGNYHETTPRGSFVCRFGDVVIKPAHLRHQNRFGEFGAVCLLLEISEELLEQSTDLFEPELDGPIRDHQLARIGLELHQELHSTDPLSAVMLEAIALRSVVSGLRFARKRPKKLAQVDAIRGLLDDGLGAAEITREYFTSGERKTVRRFFHEMEGCSMNTYALRRRALRALAELLNTDYSLAEIAHRCGFYDQAHFTKVFATLFGVTPGRFRSRGKSDAKTIGAEIRELPR
jgi:AraC family transcriptional regulator